MTRWRFEITDEGEVDLEQLDSTIKKRVLEKLRWFVNNFDSIVPIPLGEPFKGFFKLRVGDWRVVYEVEVDKNLVTVHAADHRSKIYKRFK